MTRQEKDFWKDFIELNEKDIVDTVVRLTIQDEEQLACCSYKEGNSVFDICRGLEPFFELNKENVHSGFKLEIVYLPFSNEPIHIVSKTTPKDMSNFSVFNIDVLEMLIKACFRELSRRITDKYKRLAYSNGRTYRTPDHLFDNTWEETLKSIQ